MNVLTKRFWMYYHIIVLHEIKQKKIFFKVSSKIEKIFRLVTSNLIKNTFVWGFLKICPPPAILYGDVCFLCID